MNSLKKQIENAMSVPECEAIQHNLETLLKSTKAKKNLLEEQEEEGALQFKGCGATPCSFCTNTVDPKNEDFCGTCEGCDKLACKECYAVCNGCETSLCHKSDDCGMKYCENCDESFCSDCVVECWKCHDEICEGCVTLVGPPEWKCCEGCRDEWVEDGWREY